MKFLLRCLLRLCYGFRAYGETSLNTPGPVLLLPNHVSWWDWLLLGVCLENDWRFVTSTRAAEISWVHRLIMINRRTFPIDMNSPYAVKRLAEYLQKGGRLVLFPEGRLSLTGSLMKLFDGTGFLIHKTHARVITAYLRGAHRLPFSPNPGRRQWFPKVSLHLSVPLTPPTLEGLGVTGARLRLTDWVRQQMIQQRFEAEMELGPGSLPAAILAAARDRPGQNILQDATMQSLTYRRLLLGAELLATQWRRRTGADGARVGVLLPNVNAMPVVLLSLWLAGKIPAVLNYSTGATVLLACARLASLKQIITSKAFLAHLKLEPTIFETAGIECIFLEEVRGQMTLGQKALAWLRQFPKPRLSTPGLQPATATAVVVFTSGSEGEPKAVELTHRNLLANIRQMLSVIDLWETDRFFNALPLFHSFGLTVGLLLPLIQRVFVFLYPSPLHYRVVPSAFYNLDCTIFFGTNTFLAGYARKANPSDFRSLRYLFAGAEKVQDTTNSLWMRKFGVRILEGYGATECSPCLSLNVPAHPGKGSAGQFLPGIEYRLERVEGVTGDEGQVPNTGGQATDTKSEIKNPKPESGNPESGNSSPEGPPAAPDAAAPRLASSQSSTLSSQLPAGRLFVRGPNIMRGYLNPEANARFHALGGWYDTGDIVRVDAEGFVHILGRLKRFAKISGEMVSLTAIEDALNSAGEHFGPKFAVAVIAKQDELKGERLIAVTNEPKFTLEEIRAAIKARGLNNLAVPREVKLLPHLPLLGTGKVNYRELERII